jgi:Domain of unknown function (DUF4291)
VSVPGASRRGYRQIRARYTDRTVTVYQAFSLGIADAALAAGTFVPPFKRHRATWVKPSFLWMAYRCGWAAKAGQERVLAIEITRDGFHWALGRSCLAHYEPGTYPDLKAWNDRMNDTCVRIQWDPERGLHGEALGYRSIQIGLSGEAVDRYLDHWTVSLSDVTGRMRQIHALVRAGREDEARDVLPAEQPYPLGPDLAGLIGATG